MKTVCIDAGHGGKDPGAINGIYEEAEAALDIALRLGSLMTEAGWDVIYTREDDTFVELYDRYKIANEAGADCFVSIHLNSAENKSANGTETLVYSPNSIEACDLAESVQNLLIAYTAFRDRGIKYRPGLCVLKRTKMPAILVETGFISNDDEAKYLFSQTIQESIAEAIKNGILDWAEYQEKNK